MRFRSLVTALFSVLPCFGQLQLNSDAVDTTKFRVTPFKTALTIPLGMTTLSDGSIAIGTDAGILRFRDLNHNGIASGTSNTLLAGGGTRTALLHAGNYYLEGNDFSKTMNVLKPGATPAAAFQNVGTLQITYPDGWQHNTIGFGVRPTPGQAGFYDLVFNVGSEFEHDASVDQATLSGLTSGMLDGDSLYAVTLDLTGATPAASNLRKIASGIRNVVGFGFHPVTGDFYFVDNAINGPGADGDEPPQADELNFISAANFGVTVPNFGYPACYIQYRTSGGEVGSGCVYPLFAFQPLPNGTPLGSESEGPVQMAFAPPNFPNGLNNGIFVGFAGKGIAGPSNEENAVGYYSFDDGSYIHFSENRQSGVGMPIGLLSTSDSLYIADYLQGTVYQILGSPQLSITKTHAGSFAPGQQNATYTVTVSSAAGADDTTGMVTVTETVPSGLSLVSMTGGGWSCMSNTCTISSMLVGGQSYPPITVTVNVAPDATSPQVNQATVSGGGSVSSTANDSTIIAPPLLTVVKSHTGNFVQSQQNATYTVTVSNTAAVGPTTGMVTVTDTLPSGLSLVSMAGTGWTCMTNSCTRSDALNGGASYPDITVTVNVAVDAVSPQVNQVNVTGGGSVDANTSDSTVVLAPPVLSISKSHIGNFVQGQQNATYTVTVSNTAAAGPTSGVVTVTDMLPSGLSLVSMSGTGWTCASSSCMRSDALNGGFSYPSITVTVNVGAGATSPQLNQVGVTGGGSAPASTSDSTVITLMPVLTITKSHTGNFFQGQQNATYIVSLSNTSGGPTSGTVTVTDTLPVGLSFVSMSGTGWSCPNTTCTRSDSLGSGLSYSPITVTVNVGANASSPQVNQVGVSGGSAAFANTSDSTIITLPPALTISKFHTGNFAQGQQNATYLVLVSNSLGAGSTSGQVTVTDTLPSGLTLVGMAGGGWTCTSNSCNRSDALIGGSSYPSITVTVNVGGSATSPQVNQVSVSGGNSATASTSDSTVITGNPPVLTITKSHSGNFSQAQQNATYTVTVSNTAAAGPTNSTVTVTDTLPSGLTLVSMAGAGWTCPSSSCTRSDVLTGGSSYPPITVTVNVGASATSPQLNQVSVSGGGSANASASDSTVITTNPPVLTITKSHTGSFTQGQQNATYTVIVSNTAAAGPTNSTVTVTDTLPSGLTLVSMSGAGWTCPSNSCTRSDALTGGSSYPAITVTVNVGASATSPLVNQVSVSGGGSVTASTTDSTVIGPKPPVLTIAKSHSGNFFVGQQNATYTITVANTAGAGPTSGTVTVTDTPPSGLTLVSMAGAGWTCPSNTCNRSDVLAAGSSYPAITVTVNVGASATSPQVNQASVSGGGSVTANTGDSTVISAAVPALSITSSHVGGFTQGQQNVTYAVTVSNALSGGPTSGTITVTSTLSSGQSLVLMGGSGWICVTNNCTRPDSLNGGASFPMITVTANLSYSAASPQTNQVTVTGGGSATASFTDSAIINANPPILTITKSHSGNFAPGQPNAAYTITVANSTGTGPTLGTVTVAENPPSGLTLVSMAGSGWNCAANTCTRSDVLNGGSSYPPITASVNVSAGASSPQVNQASVSGGGASSANATDSTIIGAGSPQLSITKSHSGNFSTGQQNAVYTITVSNTAGASATSGTVTVTDTLPSGLTLVSLTGSGWNCVSNSCTRADVLPGASSYPSITATVNVTANAPSPQVNQAGVSGGSSAPANASDSTVVIPGVSILQIAKSHSGNFAQSQPNAAYTITVSNSAGAGSTSGTVTVADTVPSGMTLVSMSGAGWNCASNTCTRTDALAAGSSYPAITAVVSLAANATSPLVNQASVSGGGSATANASDSTVVNSNQSTLTLNRSTLNFGYTNGLITPPQQVTVTFTGGFGVPWTASSNQSNITLSPASGTGNGTFQVTAAAGSSGIVTVSAPAATGSPKQIQINVASTAPAAPFGSFETPADNTAGIAGAVAVTGWALDNMGVSSVGIWRERVGIEPVASNGLVFLGTAVFVADARPDVQGSFPSTPDNYRAGWGYLLLTNFLPNSSASGASGNGTYKLHAIAVNNAGQSLDLGTHSITVDNADATRPFGTIDTPDQGGTVSGNAFVNFGWALTQNPFMIPFDGSTITVTVDGIPLGHPTYNQFRSDIANAFPGLANSNGAIGYFLIDTTRLTNAVHTIAWLVYDNQGRGDGIGSRFFNILNTTGGTVAEPDEPIEAVTEVKLRRGTSLNVDRGIYRIRSQELETIELQAGAAEGYLIVDGQQLPLPAGAALKAGVFYWQLAPGYLGNYEFLLIRPDGHRIPVLVTINPKAY